MLEIQTESPYPWGMVAKKDENSTDSQQKHAKKPKKPREMSKMLKRIRTECAKQNEVNGLAAYRKKRVAPWEQEKDEPAEAYKLFRMWRSMSPSDRNAEAFFIIVDGSVKSETILEYKKKYSWDKRCEAWDRAAVASVQSRALYKLQEMKDRHAQYGLNLAGIGYSAIQQIFEQMKQGIMLEPKDALALVTAGVQMERLSRDAPTEISKQEMVQVIAPDPVEMDKATARAYGIKPDSK
jgi:hypothetical protein